MLYHHVEACSRVPGIREILLMGSYDEGLFRRFIDDVQSGKVGHACLEHHGIALRYCHESTALGTAGGLRTFASDIRAKNPDVVFVLHGDICCTFPLVEMLTFHQTHAGETTLLAKRMSAKDISGQKYGCLVQDPDTREVLHWAEKPETFVSDVINCGIYILDVDMLEMISTTGNTLAHQRDRVLPSPRSSLFLLPQEPVDVLRLEQDILMPLAGARRLYVFETQDFWCQIKTPGMALLCSEMYLERFRYNIQEEGHSRRPVATVQLASSSSTDDGPVIQGNVVIHPTASVHASAKLGPNVAIGAGVTVGPGVRVMNAIILEGTILHAHACVSYAIIGWNSVVGHWTRVEGQAPNMKHIHHMSRSGKFSRDVTVFGVAVNAKAEIVVRNCIVLPHKTLMQSYHNEILL